MKFTVSKAAIAGSLLSLGGCFLLNLYSAIPKDWFSDGISFDSYETYGFPFVMHEYGTILHLNQFIWSGVLANIAVAVITSTFVGQLASFIWQGISSRKRSTHL